MLQPGGLAPSIGHGRAMAEKVDVERTTGKRAGLREHGAGLFRGAGTDTDGAQGAGIGDGGRQGRGGNAHHGGLDDWVPDAEQLVERHGDGTPSATKTWPIYLR
ncbi:hypothetical protein D3C78_1598430 [compost metagenome]